ncbi:MAG TPA: hypothetical protein VGK67_24830 [Myxococcales bacterium]|jgi:hypothetical protein
MSHRVLPLTALLLAFSTSAFAAGEELAAKAIEIAKNSSNANKGAQFGEVLAGSGKSAEWTVELASGTWYSFGLRTDAKKATLVLFAPNSKEKVFEQRARDQQVVVRQLASMAGTYKVLVKMDPSSEARVAIFAEPKSAGGDPLADRALSFTRKTAVGAKQVGPVLAASGRQVEWRVELESGQCYWFGAETSGKGLAEYLFDPGDHKIAQVEPNQPEGMLYYCATINGSHKLIARTLPPSDIRVAVFGKERNADEEKKAQNPSLAPSLACADAGAEGTGSLVVSCGGCGAMDLWIDGQHQAMPVGTTSWQVDGLAAGCHTVKVNGWTSPFHYDLWYDGRATVGSWQIFRYQSRAGQFEFVGKSNIAPPPPRISAEAVGEAAEFVRDALDDNKDDDSRCQSKLSGKLESLRDMLGDLRRGEGDLDKTVRKLRDTIDYVTDECHKRHGGRINKSLRKALEALRY